MSDPLKIPQLVVQVSKPARADESRATPDPIQAPASAAPSFASVLKAKSQPTDSEAKDSDSGQTVATDTIDAAAGLVAAMFAESSGFARIPAVKSADTDGKEVVPQAALDPAALAPAAFASTTPGTDSASSGDLPSAAIVTEPLAAAAPAAQPPVALATLPVTPPVSAELIPTAPTSAPASASSGTSVLREAARSPSGTGSNALSPQFAARHSDPADLAAKSADDGKSALPTEVTESRGDFRPMLERVTGHADGIAMHASTAQPTSHTGTEPQQIRVATPFNQTGWAQEVEQKLAWVVTNTRQQADLVLNPPDLGRIEVSLVVKGDEVSASFASPHQAVREAIEESLVRLRENLADAGISLGQTHVGRDSSRDASFARPETGQGMARRAGPEAIDSGRPLGNSVWQPARGRGLVDVFA